jgi:hypothetical protein
MKHPGVQKIIDRLETLDNGPTSECGFDMNYEASNREVSHHDCGSGCCIGGHAALLIGDEGRSPEWALSHLCDIPHQDAEDLCWPGREYSVKYPLTTLEDALGVLRYYRDTGRIDWSDVVERQRFEDEEE